VSSNVETKITPATIVETWNDSGGQALIRRSQAPIRIAENRPSANHTYDSDGDTVYDTHVSKLRKNGVQPFEQQIFSLRTIKMCRTFTGDTFVVAEESRELFVLPYELVFDASSLWEDGSPLDGHCLI
jgi:hypothetical protein